MMAIVVTLNTLLILSQNRDNNRDEQYCVQLKVSLQAYILSLETFWTRPQ